MGYDELKRFGSRLYSGMPVGGEHEWIYPDGVWKEQKVAPSKWEFTFASLKRRKRSAPVDSGAAEGTQFHWFILAHQRVRKLDADTYSTFLEGTKHKIAHKRPHWSRWSAEYEGQASVRDGVVAVLGETLSKLRSEVSSESARLK